MIENYSIISKNDKFLTKFNIYMCIFIQVYMCVQMYVYTCTHIDTYNHTYACTHTYILSIHIFQHFFLFFLSDLQCCVSFRCTEK